MTIQDDIWDERAAPWKGANERLIRYAYRHTYAVHAYDATGEIPLDVVSAAVTFDASWSPFVQGVITIRRPSPAVLARLNPRLKVRFTVDAGYMLPSDVADSHPLADHLWLSHRTRDIAEDTVTLQVQGGEYLVDSVVSDADTDSPQDLRGGWTETTSAMLAVGDVLDFTQALSMTGGTYETFGDAVNQAGWVPPGDPWLGRAGDNALGLAREVCDRTGLWFYCAGDGRWVLTQFGLNADVTHELRDGADGTIVTAAHDLSREGWANYVTVVHNWSRPTFGASKSTLTEYTTSGTAWIASGPYDVNAVGRVAVFVQRDTPSSFALTQAEAASILGRYQANAGAYDVEAVAAYWLRPGQGVTLAVDGAAPTRHTVQAVTFDLDTGRMACRLVEPGTSEVIALG